MTPYEVFSPAPLILYHTTNGMTTVSAVGTYYKGYKQLVCSANVSGDFHSPNFWEFSRRTRSNHMNAVYRDVSQEARYVGPYWNMPEGLNAWHSSELAAADNQALAKLYESIRGSLDLSIDTFQIRMTLGLVKNIRKVVDRTVALVADLAKRNKQPKKVWPKRTKPKNPKRISKPRLPRPSRDRYAYRIKKSDSRDYLKIPGDLWLQYVYGIKPTLTSIHDAIGVQKNHYCNLSRMFTGKRTNVRKDTVNLDYYLDGTWKAQVEIDSSVRVLYKCRLEIPDDSLTQAAQYTSLNPISIAWELMPYSFVIDWFINIGDYLRSVESRLIYSQYFKSGFKTTSWRYANVLAGSRKPIPNAVVFGTHTCFSSDTYCRREVLGSLPFPTWPALNPNLGASRLLSAAALLSTFLRK